MRDRKIKIASSDQLKATDSMYDLKSNYVNDDELAAAIGMTKTTLYTRRRVHNWKPGDILMINKLKSDFIIKKNESGK